MRTQRAKRQVHCVIQLPMRFAGVAAQVSAESAKRPWTVLTAGIADDSMYALPRDGAILGCAGPAVLEALGSAGLLILYIVGERKS